MKNGNLVSILLFLFLAATNVSGQTKVPPANELLKEARVEAAKMHKNIFVIFHASWCSWCHKMDDAMNDGALKTFFDNNYVIVHLTVDENKGKKDLENPGADELRKKYHGDQQGLPYWFILDENGNFLADALLRDSSGQRAASVGCPAEKNEVDYFVRVLKKTSSLNQQQLVLVEERFLKNKE
jgi:thioredoxin-related protein